MNRKEKFLRIARFKAPGELFLRSDWQWFWNGTIQRWRKDGMPEDVHLAEYFGFDRVEALPINLGIIPTFEMKLLDENKTHQIILDSDGAKKKILKEHREESMDQWLDYPLKDKKTWEEYKKRLSPDSPARLPCWWKEEEEKYKDRDYPIGIHVGSFFGWIRNWVGIENLSYLIVDNPSLIEEMEEHIEYLILTVLRKVLGDIKVDFAHFWEDMAYKTGSLVSMGFVKKYMAPHYKRITEFLHSKGIDIITLDSDGNVWELIPIWLDCGINGVMPNEVAASMDIVKMRKKFGKNLIIGGGIDKRVLSKEKKKIEEEVMKKIPYLLKGGGYFPMIDHSVPPDVPFKNYMYYLELLRKIGGER